MDFELLASFLATIILTNLHYEKSMHNLCVLTMIKSFGTSTEAPAVLAFIMCRVLYDHFISRCQGYKRVINVIQFLPCYIIFITR